MYLYTYLSNCQVKGEGTLILLSTLSNAREGTVSPPPSDAYDLSLYRGSCEQDRGYTVALLAAFLGRMMAS